MKKIILFILVTIFLLSKTSLTAKAEEKVDANFDDSITEVLSGINEEDFSYLTKLLNEIFGDSKTFKERIISFLTGENVLDFSVFTNYFKSAYQGVLSDVFTMVSCVVFIGILYTILNVINCRKYDNNDNNAIYFICYSIVVTLYVKLVYEVVDIGSTLTENVNKTVEIAFPIIITLSEFLGGFGVGFSKPISATVTFLSSELLSNFFLPIISVCFITVIVGNISDTVKLSNLNKTLLSLLKWVIGIVTTVLTLIMATHGLVNSQYSGLSFKILKYATGSIIPIVGNFISGGLDVLLSSSILVKNSIGFLTVIIILFTVLKGGITILLTSFILRFSISLCEPILDEKFTKLTGGVCEVLNVFTAILFLIGFLFIVLCFGFINSTALII